MHLLKIEQRERKSCQQLHLKNLAKLWYINQETRKEKEILCLTIDATVWRILTVESQARHGHGWLHWQRGKAGKLCIVAMSSVLW